MAARAPAASYAGNSQALADLSRVELP